MLSTVAEEPANVEHVRSSSTSFIIHWETPGTTPLGYTIFYNLSGDVNSVTVNASNSQTQTYELRVMSEGNYTISILALSRHLPSAVVGSPIISGA